MYGIAAQVMIHRWSAFFCLVVMFTKKKASFRDCFLICMSAWLGNKLMSNVEFWGILGDSSVFSSVKLSNSIVFLISISPKRRLAMFRLTSKWTCLTWSSHAFLMSEMLVSLLVMSEILVNVWQYCMAKVIKTTSPYILFKIQNFKIQIYY